MSGFYLTTPSRAGTPVGWESSTTDPRVAGLDRPIGSIIFNPSTLAVYRKTSNVATTDWARQNTTRKVVSGNATAVTIATGLSGETDIGYTIISRILEGAGGTTSYYLYPNNASTNANAEYLLATGSATPSAGSSAHALISSAVSGMLAFSITHLFARHNGKGRYAISFVVQPPSAGTNPNTVVWSSEWNETATEITSLVVTASAASGIGDASEFMVIPWR